MNGAGMGEQPNLNYDKLLAEVVSLQLNNERTKVQLELDRIYLEEKKLSLEFDKVRLEEQKFDIEQRKKGK